jgi:serine/threonine-protein kinase
MTPEDARDLQLAELLEAITRAREHGQPLDVEALAREHPELRADLHQLLNLAELACEVSRSVFASAVTVDQGPLENRSAEPPVRPPTLGDYELEEELGRGAMGVVYKAWEPALQRYVALKMMLGGEQAAPAEVSRFRSEAQAAAGLSHRHIVPVYHVGESDSRLFFSMKYVEGTTLAALVRQGPLQPRRAARYLTAISRAVQHAHEHGILHRDLKPSNVLIDGEDQPVVTDFGLAKRVEGGASLTGTGVIVGTPSYMAPEQAAGSPGQVGPASDVYSLGAILYELVTGRPPFQAASVVEVLLMVRGEEPVPPRRLNPAIDADLELICLKCLEKRPSHRYASAAALADDLEAFLQSEPVSARVNSLRYFLSRLLRETHHAPVLENWGALWILHSVKIFLLCAVTNWMYLEGVNTPLPYLALWGGGLVVWGLLFLHWRRRAGPVTFVERQMVHAWAAGVTASVGTFVVEVLLGRPVLSLSPVLAVIAGMVFLFKAGTLSGWFYVAAGLCFLTAIPMALFPSVGPLLFGAVSAVGFLVPGVKYYRQRRRAARLCS